MERDKNTTAQLKKVSQTIESSRKGIEANHNIVDNISTVKNSFN